MRKVRCYLFLLLLCGCGLLSAQKRTVFRGDIFDLQSDLPLENVCVHNISTGMATFTNHNGHFAISIKGYDTLIFTHVGYGLEHLIVSDSMTDKNNRCRILMSMKSIMLKEFTFYALKPYPLFLEDVAKEAVAMEKPISLSETEKADATAKLNPAMIVSHPVTFLYEKFSRTAKMNRLYAYLSNHEEEVARLSDKFSVELVSELTGFSGEELEDFLNYCSFSYYKLIESDAAVIRELILQKKQAYLKTSSN